MMNRKKLLAGILTATMVMGSSMAVFAAAPYTPAGDYGDVSEASGATGSGEGTGSVDVVDKTDVFCVNLPTDAGSIFSYVLDPKGVIKSTDADKYGEEVDTVPVQIIGAVMRSMVKEL